MLDFYVKLADVSLPVGFKASCGHNFICETPYMRQCY